MKQLLGNSYLYGANAPFIEALYEAWLKDPAAVEPRWRDYFDELQRIERGAADVSHFDVQDRFARLARERPAAGTTVVINRPQLGEKQFGVLQLISAYRFQGVRHAEIDPLKRREKPNIPELDPAFYGLTRRRSGDGVQRRHAGRAAGDEARGHPAVPEGHLLPHHRRRVHVHHRHGAEALGAGAAGRHPLDAELRRRLQEAHPRAADRRRDAGEIPAHPLRRPEALLAGRRANR